MYKSIVVIYLIFMFAACSERGNQPKLIPVDSFETTINGKQVHLFTLRNKNGLVTQITNLGGRVVSLWVPDRKGSFDDIVLGVETAHDYLTIKEKYFGALIGRYGNRIAKGTFKLDNDTFKLVANNGQNHLHGGIKGFNNVVWDADLIDHQTLELKYLSPHMDEGYPGNLEVKVIYKLTNDDELKIEYWATTDKATPINLTHHSFFNLRGAGKGTINDHILHINADYYTPVDEELIPTGEIASVTDTPMDFTQPIAIGERVNDEYDQLRYGGGYDHNWVLKGSNQKIGLAARVTEPVSGRVMEVFTNEPGMQFYGGNFLDGVTRGKYELSYGYRSAFCLETQHYPDSPNHDNFPSTILYPDEEYYSVCVYKFACQK